MGIDSMRVGGGRCPPILVGGLILACLMLICNWWTLSSENLELLKQIDDLKEHLKVSSDERDQCITLRENLEQRSVHKENEIKSLQGRLEQQNDLKKRIDELENSYATCKDDFDLLNKTYATKLAMLDTLKLEKNNISSQLDKREDENKKLQEELDKVKDELSKLILTQNSPAKNKVSKIQQSPRVVVSYPQLGPVMESAVKISVSGQRGLKHHGIPILPQDSPGAVRQAPRFSITMPRARTDSKLENGTLNGGNQEIQAREDLRGENNNRVDDTNNADEADNVDDGLSAPDIDRDQQMTNEPERHEDPGK